MRILLVDDDPGLRALLRATLETVDITVDEAESAPAAKTLIATRHPDVVVLDVRMPGLDGLSFCHELKSAPETWDIGVILLTGDGEASDEDASAAGADAFMRKPFSPLELLSLAERIAGGPRAVPVHARSSSPPEEQLLLYARDLRNLLELERGQRLALQRAYQDTVAALGSALESRDLGTSAHSERVQQYALELANVVDRKLAEDPSVECGFLLHDVGKIGIPDEILRKPGPLDDAEKTLMETHTLFPDALRRRIGRETALREIARCFLTGSGLTIPGELARVTGLSRPDAGRGNRALVKQGHAHMLAPGLYELAHRPRLSTQLLVEEHSVAD